MLSPLGNLVRAASRGNPAAVLLLLLRLLTSNAWVLLLLMASFLESVLLWRNLIVPCTFSTPPTSCLPLQAPHPTTRTSTRVCQTGQAAIPTATATIPPRHTLFNQAMVKHRTTATPTAMRLPTCSHTYPHRAQQASTTCRSQRPSTSLSSNCLRACNPGRGVKKYGPPLGTQEVAGTGLMA